MPESPRWLVQQERDADAARVLQRIYGKGKGNKTYALPKGSLVHLHLRIHFFDVFRLFQIMMLLVS